MASLIFVAAVVVRLLAGAESGGTAQVSAVGTMLLWVRATLYCAPVQCSCCKCVGGSATPPPPRPPAAPIRILLILYGDLGHSGWLRISICIFEAIC